MRLASLLRTPPPVHAFAVDEDELLYGRLSRRRDALMRVEVSALGAGWFHLGPVGLLQVERQILDAGLASVLGRLERAPDRASLVVPNSWVRSVLVEVGSLPHQREEAEEVLRWRLKKLLPCRPDEVRLDFRAGVRAGRVLVLLALDRPLARVEEAFAEKGIEIGRIEPAVLALSALLPPSSEPAVLATLEARALAIAVLAKGKTLLVRHKALPADARRAEVFVVRELARTLAHAREQEKLGDRVELWLTSASDEQREALQRWAEGEGGVEVRWLAMGAGRVPQ
ncbi:MAG: hypothetical protein ACHQHM_02105, partial [Thermoanaerobaculales bacterium]